MNTTFRLFALLTGTVSGIGLWNPLVLGIVQPPPAPKLDPSAVVLADEVYRLDEVGLAIRLPGDSLVEAVRIGDRVTRQVAPADASWIINIQTPRTKNPEATIKQAADETLSLIQGSVGVMDGDQGDKVVLETQAKLLSRTPDLEINGLAAERMYISIPRSGEATLIKGYTIFRPTPAQFVVFELITTFDFFERSKRVYETSLATAVFESSSEVVAARAAAVRSGAAFLSELTEADYLKALGDGAETWHRFYKAAPTGAPMDAEEIGYRGVKFWKGKRGEVDPSRAPASWSRSDHQEGWLAMVRHRLLVDSKTVADTVGVYFMTPDRKEEAWNLRTAVRGEDGKQLAAATETGARNGADIEIMVTETGRVGERIKPYIQEDGYISQLETLLLHKLMVAKGIRTELGFYAYQSRSRKVSMRRDFASREPGTRGAWTVETTYYDDTTEQRTVYNESGQFIRSELGDGRTWEPTDLQTLLRLWKQKGLPVDGAADRPAK